MGKRPVGFMYHCEWFKTRLIQGKSVVDIRDGQKPVHDEAAISRTSRSAYLHVEDAGCCSVTCTCDRLELSVSDLHSRQIMHGDPCPFDKVDD